jgi:hypothetical protein
MIVSLGLMAQGAVEDQGSGGGKAELYPTKVQPPERAVESAS